MKQRERLTIELFTVERDPADPRLPLRVDQLEAICRRVFDSTFQPVSAQELSAGTFNSTYRVEFETHPPVILRVAPPPASGGWEDTALMRREYQIQPFFAALAPLMPRIILADFTHQLIEQDYMVQTFLEGERWEEVADDLTPEENLALWHQFGSLLKTIHTTRGTEFGWPHPGRRFLTWSETVIHWFEALLQGLAKNNLDIPPLRVVLDIVRAHTSVLDEIQQPSLLHGDLWTFNLLIKREAEGPQIVGVLDADRAWWGDPLADWTMFIWSRGDGAEMPYEQEAFWQAYGQVEMTPETQFRASVYEAVHTGTATLWAYLHGHDQVQRGFNDLREIAELLSTFHNTNDFTH